METIDPREELREADRAAAAPYLASNKMPLWQSALFGLTGPLFALIVISNTSNVPQLKSWMPVLPISMALLSLFMVQTQRKNRGVLMGGGKAPAELRPVFRWYIFGAIVFVALITALALFTPWFVSLPLSYLLTIAGLTWFAIAYDRAAAKVRARLA